MLLCFVLFCFVLFLFFIFFVCLFIIIIIIIFFKEYCQLNQLLNWIELITLKIITFLG